MTNTDNVTLIPEFKAVFEQVKPKPEVVEEITRHDLHTQKMLFSAFREIMQDELIFVSFVYQQQKQNQQNISSVIRN